MLLTVLSFAAAGSSCASELKLFVWFFGSVSSSETCTFLARVPGFNALAQSCSLLGIKYFTTPFLQHTLPLWLILQNKMRYCVWYQTIKNRLSCGVDGNSTVPVNNLFTMNSFETSLKFLLILK